MKTLCAILILAALPSCAQEAVIEGRVRTAAGRPAASVLVAAVPLEASSWWRVGAVTRSGKDGRFRIGGLPAGTYALTATSSRYGAAFVKAVRTGERRVEVRMSAGGQRLRGVARHANGEPLRGRIMAGRLSAYDGDLFVIESDEKGEFSALLQPGRYRLFAEDADGMIESTVNLESSGAEVALDIERIFRVTPPAVVTWVRSHAVPLKTAEPGAPLDDLRPLRPLIGDARIVALGEATHGTREFFQLKHRMLEFLVREMGFTLFAIEASAPDTVAVNDYVLHGKGDPAAAVAGMLFWTWNTEEVLAMVRWMRIYNEDPRNIAKVRFYGFDMQNPRASARILRDYFARVDREWARPHLAAFDALTRSYAGNPQAQNRVTEALDAIEERLRTERPRYAAATSQPDWEWARRQVDLIRQGHELLSVRATASRVRDRKMAANVKWILDHEPAGTKMVVWAHNGHVMTASPRGGEAVTMGEHLRNIYGDRLRVIGFAFGRGAFQARGAGGALGSHKVRAARPASLDGGLAAAGIPLFAIDLRSATGVARQWLAAPVDHRMIGSMYDAARDDQFWATIHPLRSYDAVIFVAETSAARGL